MTIAVPIGFCCNICFEVFRLKSHLQLHREQSHCPRQQPKSESPSKHKRSPHTDYNEDSNNSDQSDSSSISWIHVKNLKKIKLEFKENKHPASIEANSPTTNGLPAKKKSFECHVCLKRYVKLKTLAKHLDSIHHLPSVRIAVKEDLKSCEESGDDKVDETSDQDIERSLESTVELKLNDSDDDSLPVMNISRKRVKERKKDTAVETNSPHNEKPSKENVKEIVKSFNFIDIPSDESCDSPNVSANFDLLETSSSNRKRILKYKSKQVQISSKIFGSKANLVNNKSEPKVLKNPSGNKLYVCNHCQKSYESVTTLKKHEKIHDNEMPFKCRYDCDSRFVTFAHRLIHERTHMLQNSVLK